MVSASTQQFNTLRTKRKCLQAPNGTPGHGEVAVADLLKTRASSLAVYVVKGDDGDVFVLKVLVDLEPLRVGTQRRAMAGTAAGPSNCQPSRVVLRIRRPCGKSNVGMVVQYIRSFVVPRPRADGRGIVIAV
jgi:hypothetical protein